jgi:hypothetical protein
MPCCMTIFIVIIIDYHSYYPMIINNKEVSITIQSISFDDSEVTQRRVRSVFGWVTVGKTVFRCNFNTSLLDLNVM